MISNFAKILKMMNLDKLGFRIYVGKDPDSQIMTYLYYSSA